VAGTELCNQEVVCRISYSAEVLQPLDGAETPAKWESADKPGSVEGCHSSGTRVATCLKRPTRKRARTALRIPIARARCFPIWSCSRWGLPCRRVLPPTRCALTAPFHPYPRCFQLGRFAFCCTFRGLAPPRRYLAPRPPEPGLSSRYRKAYPAAAWPTPARTLGATARFLNVRVAK
jgi:hypothetical protein